MEGLVCSNKEAYSLKASFITLKVGLIKRLVHLVHSSEGNKRN